MTKKQYFGVKFPFTSDGYQKFFVDLNENKADSVKSQLMHIVFTPKGQRIRNPEFGTDLIKYIFDPDETTTWEAVKNEISESVSRWATNISLRNIEVVQNEDNEHEIYVKLSYSVSDGNKVTNDSLVVQI